MSNKIKAAIWTFFIMISAFILFCFPTHPRSNDAMDNEWQYDALSNQRIHAENEKKWKNKDIEKKPEIKEDKSGIQEPSENEYRGPQNPSIQKNGNTTVERRNLTPSMKDEFPSSQLHVKQEEQRKNNTENMPSPKVDDNSVQIPNPSVNGKAENMPNVAK